MKRTQGIAAVGLAGLMMGLAQSAPAHPYTTWQADGMASDAHTHINSGEFDFADQGSSSNYNSDGVLVTDQGYYLSDGTFVEGRYVEGSVFSGGAVAGNTIVTGGGIVSLYGYEETQTTTTTTTNENRVQGGVVLASTQPGGGVKIQTDGTPYHCWCAFSADGERVPVYSTASRNATVPKHHVGGGTKTFDVESYLDGFWKVSWRERDGGIQYGWVREERVACKRTLSR